MHHHLQSLCQIRAPPSNSQEMALAIHQLDKSKVQRSSLTLPPSFSPQIQSLGNPSWVSSVPCESVHIFPISSLDGSHHHFSFGFLQLVSSFPFLLSYRLLCTLQPDDLPRHKSDYAIQMNASHYFLIPTCELSFKFLSVVHKSNPIYLAPIWSPPALLEMKPPPPRPLLPLATN